MLTGHECGRANLAGVEYSGIPERKMTQKIVLGCLAALVSFAAPAVAQTYPVKPIRMIVHFPPGGPTDLVARAIGQKMTE